MSIPKKGSRKITIDGEEYRWRVTRYQKTSGWKSGEGVMSEDYMKYARYYGLGSVKDIIFRIPIELYENPASKIVITYYGLMVDGFHGPEQLVSMKPKNIAEVIHKCRENGWNPHQKGDYRVQIFEDKGQYQTGVLLLPAKKVKGKKVKEGDFETVQLTY